METMEQQRKRPRRSFSDEYKAEVVDLCRTSGKSISEVSRDLGLTVSAVRRWVAQADNDAGRRPGMTTDEHEELVQLRKEKRVLRRGHRLCGDGVQITKHHEGPLPTQPYQARLQGSHGCRVYTSAMDGPGVTDWLFQNVCLVP